MLGQFLGVQRACNVRKVLELGEAFANTSTPRLAAFVRYLDDVAAEEIREGEAAVQSEHGDAVTLMTVHKAKGLEFPIVVVADTARGLASNEKVPLAVDRKLGIALKVVGADGHPQPCALHVLASEARKREERAEHARILYVAMTRARDYLLVAGSPVDRQTNSWFFALDAQYSLSQRNDGERIEGDGWSVVVRRRAEKAVVAEERREQDADFSRADIERRIAPCTVSAAAPETVSATELAKRIAGVNEKRGGLSKPSGARVLDPLLRGSLIHQLFEHWDFCSDTTGAIERIARHAGLPRATRAPFIEEAQRIAARFRDSAVGAQLAHALRTGGVRTEWPFLLRIEDTLVRGVIDVLLPDGTLLDYKTGARRRETHAVYESQVRLYGLALRTLTGVAPSGAYLCYLDEEEGEWACPVGVSAESLDATRAAAVLALRTPDAATGT
jgi:ATP-dependent helicase/nuclease subunit A